MMKLNSNNGITLAILVLMIILLSIIISITISTSTKQINKSADSQYKSELYIVQQAIYQKYIEHNEKGDSLEESKITEFNADYTDFLKAFKKVYGEDKSPEGNYYLLKQNEFESLGLSGKTAEKSEFIVNYETGEVYNNTKKYYSDKITPIYLPGYAKDTAGDSTSYMIEITTN